MSDVFISYARSTAKQAQQVAEALRGQGYSVWIDDDLPAHRTYSRVIEEQMAAAKAAVVIWSADAVQSEWVMSEANRAREDRKVVQVITDKTRLPMPFDTIQCADLADWTGDLEAPGWRKVLSSLAELLGVAAPAPAAIGEAPLPLPSKPSIAVMPFANLSGDPEQDYFADGMVEDITAALSRFKSLFVIASGSTLSFKGKAVSPQDAARQLGVRYVLEGSVRKAANRVRIAVKLTDAKDGAQVWSDRFEDTLDDVFELQDRVALGVAGKIEPAIREAEIVSAVSRPTTNMSSYDLYLRALPLQRTFAKPGVLEAMDLLDQALALDPDFGAAWSMVAFGHFLISVSGWSDAAETHRQSAIHAAHRALRLANDDAFVLAVCAHVMALFEGDWDGAFALLDRAVTLNPGSAPAWTLSGVVRISAGDADLGVAHLETALRLDPIGPDRAGRVGWLGIGEFQRDRLSDAVAGLKEWVQQADSSIAYAFLAASYGLMGQLDAARAALARYHELSPIPIEAVGHAEASETHMYGQRFVEGIALAQGKSPPDTAAGG
jgi:adenylate cyclase